MHRSSRLRFVVAGLLPAIALAGLASPSMASHSWGGYHWARTSNPFTVTLGDNVSSAWDAYLATTAADWSLSTVLDAGIVPGGMRPKNCRATLGRAEVCNAAYGNTGWLGVAQIWASGSHITQGTVKMNDTYFSKGSYNTPAWRNLVMCQEVGHVFGLDHQDENFSNPNLGTCMDYTNDPSANQHPNQHDYDQLELIYNHLDSTSTIAAMPAAMAHGAFDTPGEWGRAVHESGDGRPDHFVRDFGGGHKVFTFVVWAE